MPRNMSFAITTEQIISRTKTVTRRLKWDALQVGEVFHAVEKCLGLRKGQKVVRLATLRCISKRREPLSAIDPAECHREGFPELTPDQFVQMFCSHMSCKPETVVNRIEFEFLQESEN